MISTDLFSWGIRTKVALTMGGLVILSILAVSVPASKIWKQRQDAEAINRAGRLRMLSQRAVKDAYLAASGLKGAGDRLSETSREYSGILRYLLEGPGRSALRQEVTRERLQSVRVAWETLRERIDAYQSSEDPLGSPVRDSLAVRANRAGDSLLIAADRAVSRLEEQSEASIDGLILLSAILLAIQLLLAGLMMIGLYRASRPLRALFEATRQLGAGEEFRVEVGRDNEVGRLAAAFNEMAEKIRRRERELEQLKTHYQKIFDEAPYAITITRPDGEIVEANQAAWELFGWGAGEMMPVNAWELYREASRREVFVEAIAAEGQVEDFEAWLQRSDGSSFLARISSTTRPEEGGFVYQTIIQDITEHWENKRQRRIFEQAVRQSGDMIFITDTSGAIKYVNPAGEEIIGYSREELIGENPRLFQSGETPDEIYQQLWSALERGEVFRATITDRHKDGSLVHLEQTISPIRVEEEETICFVSTARDITERIEREEQMEVLNRMLRHDIGNAATHVLGFAEVLNEAETLERRAKFQAYIRRAARRITRLTQSARAIMNSLLQGEIDTRPVDLLAIVETEAVEARDIYDSLELSGPSTAEGAIYVEGTEMLSTVLGNLLHNAVEHSDRETVHVDLSVERRGPGIVVLKVADDGPGVPDRRKETIFGKEEKGLESSGTGIGLYLASQVVDRCGGKIRVEDNDPRGAVFIVELLAAVDTE